MSSPPNLQTAALFDLFAQMADDSIQEKSGFKRGALANLSHPKEKRWKVNEVRLAASYFQHGQWRFGGMHFTHEPAGVAVLRGIASEIHSKTLLGEPFSMSSVISQQMKVHLPHLPVGTQIAIGLADNDTEYSGNLILIHLLDLAQATLDDQGRILVKIDGDEVQPFTFTFYGTSQDQLVREQEAKISQSQISARPKGL